MSKVDPKQAAIFIGVLVVIASFINSTQESVRQARPDQTSTGQPTPQPQQARQTDNGVASLKTADDAAVAARKAADAAAEHANYLARYLNSGYTRMPGVKTVALMVASEDKQLNHAVANVVA